MLTFSRTTQAYDPATDTMVPTVTTITGEGIVVRGNPQRYRDLELVQSAAPTILFDPTNYGLRAFTPDFVLPGDTVVLNGVTMSVKDVDPVAPDGYVIIARIIVSV